ncbi:hypothetical protein E2C01_004664 [Portunus trituberculatus]|uniref:Uncharacterized protein n=1 Tax=Portunus trituberculatus TaxID=210409 RepID=A0A5B7CQ90_PORTR|nr:hypothetical protein [Portunus trituberculatus]
MHSAFVHLSHLLIQKNALVNKMASRENLWKKESSLSHPSSGLESVVGVAERVPGYRGMVPQGRGGGVVVRLFRVQFENIPAILSMFPKITNTKHPFSPSTAHRLISMRGTVGRGVRGFAQDALSGEIRSLKAL